MRLSTFLFVSCLLFSGVIGSSKRIVKRHAEMMSRSAEYPKAPTPEVMSAIEFPPAKRGLRKRCIARNSTSISTTSTTPSAPAAPVNVAPSPSVGGSKSSSKQSAASSSSSKPTSSSKPPPPPPPPASSPKPSHSSSSPPPSSSPKPSHSSSPPPPSSSPKPSHSSSPPPPASSPKPSHSSTPPPPPPAPSPSQPTSVSGVIASIVSNGVSDEADITFYGTGLGACGIINHDGDFIAAASELLFDGFPGATGNPNNNPICNRRVLITYQGKSVAVTITDRCVACAAPDLDLSPAAFRQLADQSIGRLHEASWRWCNGDC